MRKGKYIRTFTGIPFYPLDPREEDIEIEDIAHALSNLCRYTGQCREFYSVAQHSYYVSRRCEPQHALWGLLHDASEAYICDVARPVKHLPELQKYREIEDNITRVVARKFGLSEEIPENIHTVDRRLLITEMKQLMPVDSDWKTWRDERGVYPFDNLKITPIDPTAAKFLFMAEFNTLIKANNG